MLANYGFIFFFLSTYVDDDDRFSSGSENSNFFGFSITTVGQNHCVVFALWVIMEQSYGSKHRQSFVRSLVVLIFVVLCMQINHGIVDHTANSVHALY